MYIATRSYNTIVWATIFPYVTLYIMKIMVKWLTTICTSVNKQALLYI
jgi:hypothetical protein